MGAAGIGCRAWPLRRPRRTDDRGFDPRSPPRLTTGLLLPTTAALVVPVALRERATADFLTNLGQTPGFVTDTGSAPYDTAYKFDLVVAAVLAVIALMVLAGGGRGWYVLAGIASCFTMGVGVWALRADHPEVATPWPITGLSVALASAAALAAIASIISWAALPAITSIRPMIPPVPPSHQAG